LRQACAKQRALPGIGIADCAVISAKTIRDLATRISQSGASWGYDTTQKYLVVLCALHFLYKGKSPEGGVEYLFPLCRYSPPPTLDPLEKIIDGSRHKVQSFAHKAKRRFLVYMEQQPSLTLPVQAVASRPFDLSGAVEDIEQVMREELGNGALPQRLLLKISGVLRYRCQSSSDEQKGDSSTDIPRLPLRTQMGDSLEVVAHNGRLSVQRDGVVHATDEQESSSFRKTGDFLEMASQNGQLSPQTGDSLPADPERTDLRQSPLLSQTGDFSEAASHKGRLFRQTGDSLPVNPVVTPLKESPASPQTGDFSGAAAQTRRLFSRKGDSPAVEPVAPDANKPPISPPKGDFSTSSAIAHGRLSPQTGHSSPQKGDSVPEEVSNVNVILHNYIASFLNDNDKSKVIEYLRTIFDEAPSRRGYYHHLYKHYPHPDAWLAAAIETLIAYRVKKTTTTPGKYFYDLCAIFHQQGIPPEVTHHVQQYSYLPYGELLAVLARSPSPGSAAKSGPVRPAKIQRPAIVARLPRETGRSGMSRADAKRALALLKSDTRTYQLRLTGYRQTDGSCVLLADDGMQHPRQVWIYAFQEAEHRLAMTRTLDDFFTQEVQ